MCIAVSLNKLYTVRLLDLNTSVSVIWKDKGERLTELLKVVLGGGCFLLDQYGKGWEYVTSQGQMITEVRMLSTWMAVKLISIYACRRNVSKI